MVVINKIKRLLNKARKQEEINYISDEFIDWLCFANAGMLERGNIWCFDYAISNLPSLAPMIEIGSFCGLSTNVMNYLKLKHGVENKLICSDAWEFEGAEEAGTLGKHPYIQHQEYKEFVKSNFKKNISFFSRHDLPFAIELKSNDFFDQWRQKKNVNDVFGRTTQLGEKISFAYIDGNHTYNAVLCDFQNVDSFLEIGGFILFDDSADGSGWEVCQVVNEISKSPRYQLIKKNPNYLFKKLEHLENID